MEELDELKAKIENTRMYLNELVMEKGMNLQDHKVIKVSMELDQLLNAYMQALI